LPITVVVVVVAAAAAAAAAAEHGDLSTSVAAEAAAGK